MFTPVRRRIRTAALALSTMAALALGATATTGAAAAPAAAKQGPTSVAYVEVNNNSMLNVGKYTLANGGAQVFDVAVIFAANINYDAGTKAGTLYFNPNVQSVLDNAATQIRPLQQKGIKVVLSVLGNHQGAGFANFPSQQTASTFAKQLSDTVTKYGLDGIDFDDEYADYGNNGTGQPNASSFVYLVSALRANMPTRSSASTTSARPRRACPTAASTSRPSSTTPGTRTTAAGRSPASHCPSRSCRRRPSRSAAPRRARPPASPRARSARGTASS
jgi:hypothetical protein